MFDFFKKRCPLCKMKLEGDKQYPEGFGKQFCSENCKEEYRKQLSEEQSRKPRGCCH